MDFVGIFLLFFLGYRNSVRARQRGLNGILWALLTVASYIVFEAFGLFVVVAFFCKGAVDLSMLSNPHANFDAVSRQFNQQVAKALIENPLREATVFMFGLGGYLLIRYLLERRPLKNEPGLDSIDNIEE